MFTPDLGEEETNKELDEVRELITSNGGNIFNEDIWGVRELAYPIRKQEQAFYAVFNFEMPPQNLKDLEKPMGLNQQLVRYLITKTPSNYEMVTLEEYEEVAAKEKEEREKEKAEKEANKRRPASPKPRETKKIERKEAPKKEVKEEKKEEPKEEAAPETVAPKREKKPKLDEVDEKLKSIIDDPDISL